MLRLRAALGLPAGLLTLLILSAPVRAGDPFQDHYDRGVAAYKRGAYADAIPSLQRAYDLRPLPRLLINIGRAHLKLRHAEQALTFLRLYLRTETNAQAAVLDEVERDIRLAEQLRAEKQTDELFRGSSRPVPPPVTRPPPQPAAAAAHTPDPLGQAKISSDAQGDSSSSGRSAVQLASHSVRSPTAPQEREGASEPREPTTPREPRTQHRPDPHSPPMAETTPVMFVARDGRTRYALRIGESDCVTPCALALPRGEATLQVYLPRGFTRQLDIPPLTSKVNLQHLTTGRIIAGAVLTPIGTILGIIGTAYLASPTYNSAQRGVQLSAGVPLALLGGGALIAGVVNLALIRGNGVVLTTMALAQPRVESEP